MTVMTPVDEATSQRLTRLAEIAATAE